MQAKPSDFGVALRLPISMAGTAALWSRAGCRFVYVICTDGNAGSHDPEMTAERLSEIRRAEQRAACALLGVDDVVFLGFGDGQLQSTLELANPPKQR